ncbi:TRASH domain protein [Desulfomarina sp.]
MSPIRILILAILVYIAYRLIFGAGTTAGSGREPEKTERKEMPVDDVLEEDPICGKLVPRKQAVRYHRGEKTVYFCSEECCGKYKNDQEN